MSDRAAAANAEAWMRQWRDAGPALAQQRRRELRDLSPEAALALIDALLSLGASMPLRPDREHHSGLVEQQAIFGRARP